MLEVLAVSCFQAAGILMLHGAACRLSELACPTEIMIGNAMPIKSPHRR